jgi:hypothetical protein
MKDEKIRRQVTALKTERVTIQPEQSRFYPSSFILHPCLCLTAPRVEGYHAAFSRPDRLSVRLLFISVMIGRFFNIMMSCQ